MSDGVSGPAYASGADEGAAPRAADGAGAVDIRHVRTREELDACVELQAATWGAGFRESVPATILKISQRLGGVTAGAFAADGTLLGFVFGMTGLERGEIVHWSDMLAVRAGLQDRGIGRRLKEFQRDAVRAVGAVRMYWTYDPLVARNAHFNINRLGARVAEYVPDMYGTDTGSVMHSGFGTDRFVVVWPLVPEDAGRARSPAAPPAALREAPVLNAGPQDGADLALLAPLPHAVRVEIPPDIFRVQAEAAERAVRWRETTRRAFQWALARGYAVHRFDGGGADGRCSYLLTRTAGAAAAAPAAP